MKENGVPKENVKAAIKSKIWSDSGSYITSIPNILCILSNTLETKQSLLLHFLKDDVGLFDKHLWQETM